LAPPKPRSRIRTGPSAPASAASDTDETASIATPSLDHSSALTSESSPFCYHPTQKYKPNALAKTWANESMVPVIVENPIEETGLVIPMNTLLEDDQESPPLPPPRRRTQTGESKEKRKSLFGTLCRSVVESVSRGGHSPSAKKPAFDISNLPPSPTVPASLAGLSIVSSSSAQSNTSNRSLPRGRTAGSPRQAVSPTIHSHGSILLQTNHIKDDEIRRMTEMAFLG